MPEHDDVIPDSTYPPLEPPGEFKSQIPEHLLGQMSDTDRYMLEQMSILRQHNDWSTKAHLSIDRSVRLTNGRLRRAESDIADLKGDKHSVKVGWKVIAAIVGGIVTLAGLIIGALQVIRA